MDLGASMLDVGYRLPSPTLDSPSPTYDTTFAGSSPPPSSNAPRAAIALGALSYAFRLSTVVKQVSGQNVSPVSFTASDLALFLKGEKVKDQKVVSHKVEGNQVVMTAGEKRSKLVNRVIMAVAVLFFFVSVPALLFKGGRSFLSNTFKHGVKSTTEQTYAVVDVAKGIKHQKAREQYLAVNNPLAALTYECAALYDSAVSAQGDKDKYDAAISKIVQFRSEHKEALETLKAQKEAASDQLREFGLPTPEGALDIPQITTPEQLAVREEVRRVERKRADV